ncbi:MAG: type I restriction enzyme HsdR N-terminal domain-containing protein [Alphaproteobacteria bacterium]|nr:type I restriction enzyme HsdR N-terminal domain-containing protein [Alphaproteobacteria bacterium]
MLSEEQRNELRTKIQKHANICMERVQFCKTEEATKQSLVLPFISILGYDVFNMQEVIPEFFTGAYDSKKNQRRIDYVITKDGAPSIAIECKSANVPLERVDKGQLGTYFHSCRVKLGILTNGIRYEFYADCKEATEMDKTPFIVFDMEKIAKQGIKNEVVNAIAHFIKSELNPNSIKEEAKKKLIASAIMNFLKENSESPSDEFVKLILANTGIFKVITSNTIQNYKKAIVNTISSFVEEQIQERVSSNAAKKEEERLEALDGIVTTEGEKRVYSYAIKRLAYLVDTDELYEGLKEVHYQDYKTTFIVYYKKNKDGRLFNLKELNDGKFEFVFPALQREITTSNLKDIDEALLASYKIRVSAIDKGEAKIEGIRATDLPIPEKKEYIISSGIMSEKL